MSTAAAPDTFFDLEERANGVSVLTLCRPERLNTMAPAFFPALRDAVQRLQAEGRTRALVIASTGKHFSAGMALDVFASDMGLLDTSDARRRLAFQTGLRQLMACFDALEQAHFPVIAAIQGGCLGGALDLAAACDLRVCSTDAFFAVQEIHIARELAFTGDRLGAERALAVGLVNAVLPDAAGTLARALELATAIAAKSPLAMAGSKLALNYAVDHPTMDALQQMTLLQSAIFDIGEMGRAIDAWQRKAPSEFAPRAPMAPI